MMKSKLIFKKPGPATSIVLNSLKIVKRFFLKILAKSTDGILLYFANTKAALQDKAAFSLLGGNSIVKPLNPLGIFITLFLSFSSFSCCSLGNIAPKQTQNQDP